MSGEFIDRQRRRRRRSRSQQIDKALELTQRVVEERRAPSYGQEYFGQKIVGANGFLMKWMDELQSSECSSKTHFARKTYPRAYAAV